MAAFAPPVPIVLSSPRPPARPPPPMWDRTGASVGINWDGRQDVANCCRRRSPTVAATLPELDFEAAHQHLAQLSCSDRQGRPWPLFATCPGSLGIYGVGIELYFRFTRRFATLFGFVVLVVVPLVTLNFTGDTLDAREVARNSGSFIAWLARTTIANLGTPAAVDEGGAADFAERSVKLLGHEADIRDVTLALGTIDALVAFVVLVAAVWFEFVTIPGTIKKHRRMHVTPEAFTLAVKDLPRYLPEGHDAYADQLRGHFEALLRAKVSVRNVVGGLLVVRESDGGSRVATRRWCCLRCRAGHGRDHRGRRLGRVVSFNPREGVCNVEWQPVLGIVAREVTACALSQGSGSNDGDLLDARLLERMERDGCSPDLHVPDEPLVHQVSLVRDYGGSHGRLRREAQLRRTSSRRVQQTGWAKTKGHLAAAVGMPKKPSLSGLSFGEDADPAVLGAFVVFNRARHRDFLHNEYRFSRTMLGRWMQGAGLRFGGRAVHVCEAPAPSNIFWENLGFPRCEKFVWRLAATLACVLLLVSCAGIFSAAKQAGLAAKEYGEATQVYVDIAGTNSTCEEVGYRKVIANQPAGIRNLCREWLEKKAKAAVWAAAAALVVVVVNSCLEFFVVKLVDLQRPKTVTSRSRRVMNFVFLVQLVNLGFITVLVHVDFGVDFIGTGFLGLIGNGSFQDMTFEWYIVVGGSVCLTMCLNMFVPLLSVGMELLKHRWREHAAPRPQSQEDLLFLYTPSNFELGVRHAQQLSSLFVTLMFSACMPLLIVLAFGCSVLRYWSDKLVLLRHARVPPRYTEDLILHLVRALPFALWLHSAIAVWVYGQPEVVPSYCYNCIGGSTVGYLVDNVRDAGLESVTRQSIRNRIFAASALPNLVVLVLTTTLFFAQALHFILGRSFAHSFEAAVTFCGVRRARSSMQGRHSIFDEAFSEAPLREMMRTKVAHSYELSDVEIPTSSIDDALSNSNPFIPNLQAGGSAPSSPSLLDGRQASPQGAKGGMLRLRRTTATGSRASPPSPVNTRTSWTAAECSAYVKSLRLASRPGEEPVQRFLEDTMSTQIPPPWVMVRDRRGRVYFVNKHTRTSTWHHPFDHLLLDLADVCRTCLECSEPDRNGLIHKLQMEWKYEAERQLSKWCNVPQEGGRSYFYNRETNETMWRHPAEAVFPEYLPKIVAIGWLLDRAYIRRIVGEEAPELADPFDPPPCPPVSAPHPGAAYHPHCTSPHCR